MTNDERSKEAFTKAGWWPNEVLWKVWQQAVAWAQSENAATDRDTRRTGNGPLYLTPEGIRRGSLQGEVVIPMAQLVADIEGERRQQSSLSANAAPAMHAYVLVLRQGKKHAVFAVLAENAEDATRKAAGRNTGWDIESVEIVSRPAEFFTEKELAELLDAERPHDQCRLLQDQAVPFVRDRRGRPLVYRDRLLPASKETDNASPPPFDFSAARRASRQAAHRRKSRPAAGAEASRR